MDLRKLIKKLSNIRIAGFRIKLDYRRKPLHEDMWTGEQKTYEDLLKYKPKQKTKN